MSREFSSACISVLALAFLCSSALAQSSPIDKGSIILSGDLGLSSETLYYEEGTRDTSIWIRPSLRYFVFPGLAVGIAGDLGLSGHFQENYNTDWDIGVGIGPRLSYFVGEIQPGTTVRGTAYPFLDLSVLCRYSASDTKGNKLATLQITGNLGGGICYMLSDRIGFTVTIVRAYSRYEAIEPEGRERKSKSEISMNAGTASIGAVVLLY